MLLVTSLVSSQRLCSVLFFLSSLSRSVCLVGSRLILRCKRKGSWLLLLLLIILGWKEIYWELLSGVVFLFGGGLQFFLFCLREVLELFFGVASTRGEMAVAAIAAAASPVCGVPQLAVAKTARVTGARANLSFASTQIPRMGASCTFFDSGIAYKMPSGRCNFSSVVVCF